MGNSTFIEINNDCVDEIAKNPKGFVATLVTYMYTGQKDIYIPGVMKMKTLHRDETECKQIQALLKDTK